MKLNSLVQIYSADQSASSFSSHPTTPVSSPPPLTSVNQSQWAAPPAPGPSVGVASTAPSHYGDRNLHLVSPTVCTGRPVACTFSFLLFVFASACATICRRRRSPFCNYFASGKDRPLAGRLMLFLPVCLFAAHGPVVFALLFRAVEPVFSVCLCLSLCGPLASSVFMILTRVVYLFFRLACLSKSDSTMPLVFSGIRPR